MTASGEKKSWQNLIEQFKNLHLIFDCLPSGVLLLNASDGIVLAGNRVAAEMLNHDAENLEGKKITSIVTGNPGLVQIIDETINNRRPVRKFTLGLSEDTTVLVNTALFRTASQAEGVVLVIQDITATTELKRSEFQGRGLGRLIGTCEAMQDLYHSIRQVSRYDTTVLINGETGTGKELVARTLHELSERVKGPFIPVNCSALSTGLLESELFGHVKGGFTGALSDRKGRFELASGGTLFLDEIGALSEDVQVKLLRILQERTFEKVGSSVTIPVNVRILSATNRNLQELITRGQFREDLFYRLKVFQIDLPPLRERKADIPQLVQHFIEKFNRYYGRRVSGISYEAESLLMRYYWPGNVRELENAVEYALILTPRTLIKPQYLPPEIRFMDRTGAPPPPPLTDLAAEEEKIRRALVAYGYNVSRTAASLGMHRTTLWRKMREFGISRPR